MNHTDDHKLQAVDHKKPNKLQLTLKRILQFLISFSVFSMFLAFPIPSTSQFLTSLFSLLSRTLERKYMFLICNGILAFLAKKSVSSASSPSGLSGLDGQLSVSNPETVTVDEEVPVEGMEALEDDVILVTTPLAAAEEEEEEEKEADIGQAEQEIKYLVKEEGKALIEENEGIKEEEKGFLVKQEVDEDGEEAAPAEANEEVAKTEELNRRFEEFIRKMKEEIRIEPQQQLIAV